MHPPQAYSFAQMVLCGQRWRSSIQSAKTRPGADWDSDRELLIAKFRLKLMKIGKTTRLFRYDLNQIPYNYTLEVRNRFKGLDLIDQVPDKLWTEVCDIVHGFQIGKGVRQGYILSPCSFNFYAEYIMRNAGLKKHKLESRLPGEISITSDMQRTPPLWQKVKRN